MVGLGNPGNEFEGTRHNLGADVVRLLAERHEGGKLRPMKGQHALVKEVRIGGSQVVLAVPTTYVNESGIAARSLLRQFGGLEPGQLVVVHDELDLPPGVLRIKRGGGVAGHNGLRSVKAHLHSGDFLRVRIGIGKPGPGVTGADYVLRRPSRAERIVLGHAVSEAADAVETIAAHGVEAAMNRFNARTTPAPSVS